MAANSGSSSRRGSVLRLSVRQIVIAGILGGIAIFLGYTRLGFIPGPNISGNATIMHLPAILGGAFEGPLVGAIVGAIFGIFSFIQVEVPFFRDPLVSIVPRLFIGVVVMAVLLGYLPLAAVVAIVPQAIAEAIVAAVVTVVVVRGVMLYRSGRTTAPESKSDEERRY